MFLTVPQDSNNKGYAREVSLALTTAAIGALLSRDPAIHKGLIIAFVVVINAAYWVNKRFGSRVGDPEAVEEALCNKARQRVFGELTSLKEFVPASAWLSIRKSWRKRKGSLHSLDPTQHLAEIFREQRSLVILGEPGSGKTVILLELAADLLSRPSLDEKSLIPVVLSLSSWNGQHGSLREWLVEELWGAYGVSKDIGLRLIQNQKLVLFLDGLDEVRPDLRRACVEEINRFSVREGVAGIAVCSRSQEYNAIGEELKFAVSISLEPLSQEQIDDYLRGSDENLKRLGALLKTDQTLRHLAQEPWMLNLMIAVAPILNPSSFSGDLEATYRKRVFNLYISNQLLHKQPEKYSSVRVVNGLSWLAKKMRRHTGTVLLIEALQPDWLRGRAKKWPYSFSYVVYMLGSRVLGAFTVYLTGVLIMWFCRGVSSLLAFGSGRQELALLNVRYDLLTWILITGVLGGLTSAALDLVRPLASGLTEKTTTDIRPIKMWLLELGAIALNVLVYGVVFFLAGWIALDRTRGLYGALIYGTSFGLVFWFRSRDIDHAADIRMAEAINWSRGQIVKGSFAGIAVGAVLGVISFVVIGLISDVRSAIYLSVLPVLSGGIIGGIINGLTKVSEIQKGSSPGQGLRTSIKNTALISLFIGIPFSLLFWSYGSVIVGPSRATLEAGLFFGLVVGILVGFAYAGLDVVYHYFLRVVLRLTGLPAISLNKFLQSASQLAFVQPIGREYKFRHPSLQDHFAALTPEDKLEIDSETGQSVNDDEKPSVGIDPRRSPSSMTQQMTAAFPGSQV